MSQIFAITLLCLLRVPFLGSDPGFGDIKVLEGYEVKQARAVDAATWTIWKKGGLSIDFEAGMNEGLWADSKEKGKYLWYREQIVNGHKVMLALVKPGQKTVWEPNKPRSRELGNILLVTFPLGGPADHTANFKAEILNQQELADALLMIMTFDPSKI